MSSNLAPVTHQPSFVYMVVPPEDAAELSSVTFCVNRTHNFSKTLS